MVVLYGCMVVLYGCITVCLPIIATLVSGEHPQEFSSEGFMMKQVKV